MRILLLSRPIVNAGDFLFTEKSIEAIEKLCPYVEVESGHISNAYEERYIDSFDVVVAAGGPLYDNAFLTESAFPILKYVNTMHPKFYFLSNGWYGKDAFPESVFQYRFDNDILKNMDRIEKSGGGFSSRDSISAMILKNNGIRSVSMIGCTSWYDYDKINDINPVYKGNIKRILISDQGITKDYNTWDRKYRSVERLINTVEQLFPESELLFTFNGGIDTKYSAEYNYRICELLKTHNIRYKDISGSSYGFRLCLDTELHIGFRMHTHIYCMSKRIPSILISEDARGSALNQTLGMPDILDFAIENGKYVENKYLEKQLQYYIDELKSTDYELLSSVYQRMRTIYNKEFVPFIRRICRE